VQRGVSVDPPLRRKRRAEEGREQPNGCESLLVAEAKRQARNSDPGEEVPKGTAAQGERKAVSSIRASTDEQNAGP
jgi:hypothetical protein